MVSASFVQTFFGQYLNIHTSGRHVRKRSSDRVGEAANQHEKNIW
ncbi:unnamed protein product [Brassica oleracea]